MGTNRRSRLRSAARILNSTNNQKRQRILTDSTEGSSFDNLHQATDLVCEFSHDRIHDDDMNENFTPHSPDSPDDQGCSSMSSPFHLPTEDIGSPSDTTPFANTNANTNNSPNFTTAEICSYELMTLLDEAGCPRNTYEQVVSLLKKQEKRGFSFSKAHSRDKLLNILRQKFHCPIIQSNILNNCEVFSFPFVDMLQDLIETAGSSLHIISPTNPENPPTSDELWNTKWMQETFQCPLHQDFNSNTDIMLPLILYLDKTGTDVLQRYSLEPILFSLAALKRESRENRHYWRHLGFIPSSKSIEDSKESLQFYHHCLGFILAGLKEAQRKKPLVRVKTINGSYSYFHAHLPVMMITGDQLSQDTLCCRRKANAGGAGRVHRSCMCSYLSTDDHTTNCQPISRALLEDIISLSTRKVEDVENIIDKERLIQNKTAAKCLNSRTMKYFRKQRQLFNIILSKPFTTHPVVSAFHDIDFGAWTSGVYDATFDDFMHSFEEGMMENIGGTLFDGLVSSESEKVETMMMSLLTKTHSSARSTFPRWRLQKGFSRQTLMTMGERVGSIFSIALALHNPEIAKVFHDAHERQRAKYATCPISDDVKDLPMYYEQYLHTMTLDESIHTLTHLYRHGFDISVLETMDLFQINQLIWNTSGILTKTTYPESYPEFASIDGLYKDRGSCPRINQRLVNLVQSAMNPQPEEMFRKHRFIPVEGVLPKHHRKKNKQKGDGSTCAFLGTRTSSLILFLEYTLCYHAFCKYSSSLPVAMRSDQELIEYSGRSLLSYFGKMIYRGDDTIDSRTTKIHAQRRLGHNFRSLGNVMHSCCEVGERLLKTEAKKISRTAQQRGSSIFERQTCTRILDRQLMDKMRLALSTCPQTEENIASGLRHEVRKDSFSRQQPHFLLNAADASVMACDRKGRKFAPDTMTGCLSQLVVRKLIDVEPDLDQIEIYNEVILRDGSYVRAFPNYRGDGPWYDFVNIIWEEGDNSHYILPAQCLAFYRKEEECMAIVQSVEVESRGKVPGYHNSILTTHYTMQCMRSGVPILYSVNCASIDCTVLGFDHKSESVLLDHSRRSVMIVRPRNEWAYAWYVWNQHLRSKNKNRTLSRPFVDLGTEEMVSKVRKLITEAITIRGKA